VLINQINQAELLTQGPTHGSVAEFFRKSAGDNRANGQAGVGSDISHGKNAGVATSRPEDTRLLFFMCLNDGWETASVIALAGFIWK
jgi:hypothetical protein